MCNGIRRWIVSATLISMVGIFTGQALAQLAPPPTPRPQPSQPPVSGPPSHGVLGGVETGVPGGVPGGVASGVPGGVLGGVVSGVPGSVMTGVLGGVIEAPEHPPRQEPPPPPPPAPGQPAKAPTPTAPVAARPAPPSEPPQRVNVKLEVTISEQRGSAPPITKLVSMTLADRERGSVRSQGNVPYQFGGATHYREVPLNVDAEVVSVYPETDRLRVRLTLDYKAPAEVGSSPASEKEGVSTSLRESLGVILTNGKPLVVSQAADPVSDRRVTVEVKATIMR